MQTLTLDNGLKVIFHKRATSSVAVEVTVKTGSNDEEEGKQDISHFLEHMVFEGTKKRKTNKEIANEIEKIGGELNAYTSNEKTCFFVKVLKKHFETALDVISDVVINPLFEEQAIRRERDVILKEIGMVKDEPRFHQWILFQKALYERFPAKNPTYGTVKDVRSIRRDDLLSYHRKNYAPGNMIVSVVGDINDPFPLIEKYFGSMKKMPGIRVKRAIELKQKKKKRVEKRKIQNSYVVLGYKAVTRREKDSYVLDVVKAILGRGQSGKLFIEIRNKRGLVYEIGVNNESNINYGYFAVYLNTDKKNIPLITKLILEEFKKLKDITETELKETKDYLEGEYILHNEDNFHLADELNFWGMAGDANMINTYVSQIKKVTKKDINRVVDRYLTDDYCLAVIEQS